MIPRIRERIRFITIIIVSLTVMAITKLFKRRRIKKRITAVILRRIRKSYDVKLEIIYNNFL